MFDSNYFNAISKFLNEKDGIIYNIEDLTDDYDKFIFHIKYYIDTRRGDDLVIELNNQTVTEIMYNAPYVQLKVYEFFEGIKLLDPNKIHPAFLRIDRVKGEDTAKPIPPKPEAVKKSTKGLFSK